MLKSPIFIQKSAFIAAVDSFTIQPQHAQFTVENNALVSRINPKDEERLQSFLETHSSYKNLDRSVQLALLCAQDLGVNNTQTAVNIGSSRGATGLWENFYSRFRESGTVPTPTSPLTTLGNISSWVAQDLDLKGMAMSHSITCATASHAIVNGIAWLESGMAQQVIAGGSEAPLTEFTIAQMKALRIYSEAINDEYPCKALDVDKKENSMILGEAAALLLLSKKQENANIAITGYGPAIEPLTSATSVSDTGTCLQESMKQAIGKTPLSDIDAVITHAPGTIKGDRAELNAIKKLFGSTTPVLCNNKWQVGHSLGASGALSVCMAIEMLEKQCIVSPPYLNNHKINTAQKILVNATGFGGNAVSLLIEKLK